tara:strand:- start:6607 stop:7590 length:984 start_codon:yes stop_codon:yes gene_type:complete
MARKKPFALDKFFQAMTDKKGIAKGRAIQDWYGEKADEATMELADIMSKMQKNLKGPKGVFKGWQKALLPILVGAVGGPGAAAAVGALMAGTDLMKTDKEYSKRIKELEKMATTKGKYAGTFLENYIEQGLSGIKSSGLQGLRGGKKLGRVLGGAEILLSLLPGIDKIGKKAGEKIGKKAGEEVAKEVVKDVTTDAATDAGEGIAADVLKDQIGTVIPVSKGVPKLSSSLTKVPLPGTIPKGAIAEEFFKNISSLAKDYVPQLGTVKKLTKPLISPGLKPTLGQSLLSSLTTPSMYTPLATEWYKKRNIGQSEPILQRAPNPYKRWN